MIKRFIYWLTHKHPCNKCCVFCEFYKQCREDTENTCVCCGAIIPEGRQVCPNCEEEK